MAQPGHAGGMAQPWHTGGMAQPPPPRAPSQGQPSSHTLGSLYHRLPNHRSCSALPLPPETSSAPDVSLSPWLNFRASWRPCCQPVLAHSSAGTLTTPSRLAEQGGCCPAAVGASWGCPGKAARAGGGAQPAEKVWQGPGSQLGPPCQLGLWDETVFPLEFAMSHECGLICQ